MPFQVSILGVNAALPAYSRFPTAQFLQAGGHYFLIDCGEGAQIQMQKFGLKKGRIDKIFISHLHADHYAGLFSLLGTYVLQNREAPLTIYGPPGLEDITRLQLFYSGTNLPFPLDFVTLEDGFNVIFESDSWRAYSFPLQHRVPTYGFLFREKNKKRKVIKEKVTGMNVPKEAFPYLKAGEDYTKDDQTFYAEELTRPPDPPLSYAYVSDTLYDPGIISYIHECSLLYHEATFTTDFEEKAGRTMHTTAAQAAKIAVKANAGKLLLGHFSTRFKDTSVFEEEAQKVFPDALSAVEGQTYKIGS